MSQEKVEKGDIAVAHSPQLTELEKGVNPDAIIPGSENVTEGELAALRHVPDRLPLRIWLVAFAEFAERWTYYGTVNIFTNYMRAGLPPGSIDGRVVFDKETGVAGALGLGVQKTFALRTFNSFWVYLTPFVGAFVADLKLGRYNTILIFSLVCLVGHMILIGSATPAALQNPDLSLGLLIVSIIIMGVGAGSIKSCVSPLVAEQYTGKLRKETLPSGEVIIKSPELTFQSIYLWFYLLINLGACGAISASFLARDYGYWKAYLVPTCVFLLVPFAMVAGRKYYIITPPRGSILLETLQVLRLCIAEKFSWNPIKIIKGMKSSNFYDVAKPSMYEFTPASITWDDEFVGEVRRTVKACYVFLFFPFYWLCYSQIDNNLAVVSASLTLRGTPNDVVQNLNAVSLVVLIPIMDFFVYPAMRRARIRFTPIKRITVGFYIAGSAMIYGAVLQKYIYETSPCHDNHPSECTNPDGTPSASTISIWAVAGPYILVAISEIFASITSLEYAFTKAPKRMRSVVMAFAQLQIAVSAALNFTLTAVNVEERYAWLFGSFAVVAFCIGTAFFFIFRAVDKAETQLNQIGVGERAGFKGETPEMTSGIHGVGHHMRDQPAELDAHQIVDAMTHRHAHRKASQEA